MTGSSLERADLARVRIADDLAVDVLREQIAPGASDAELAHFARVCTVLDLSPFAGQIVLIGRQDRRVGRVVFRPQITVDGRRARAERTGLLDGIEGPVWCGPRVVDDDGRKLPLDWLEVWDNDDDPPYCARTLVYRKDFSKPANGTAKFSEFVQWVAGPDRRSGPVWAPLWARMPSHMLGKVSESMALRRAFPSDNAYVYTGAETVSALADAESAVERIPPPAAGREVDAGGKQRDDDRPPDSAYDDDPEAYGYDQRGEP